MWVIVNELHRVRRPVSVTHSVQALTVIIADMLAELDWPEHALGILVTPSLCGRPTSITPKWMTENRRAR